MASPKPPRPGDRTDGRSARPATARRAELAVRRAVQRLIPAGSNLLIAVSGGGDSVALLRLLLRFRPEDSGNWVVGHLDHGLRRGSRADRKFVERLSRQIGLGCLADRRDVPALRRRGESPEEAARRVRRQFLLEAARAGGSDWIVTGHTLDDQAETVLMRLVRGGGARALAGMSESGPGPFLRPLLELERAELRAVLHRHAWPFREDPTNRQLRFDRNRVRRLILPLLAETLNPRAAHHLVKAADLLREDACYLDLLAQEAFARFSRPRPGGLVLDATGLAATARPLGSRVVLLALRAVGADPRRLTSRHVDALLQLAGGVTGKELDLPGRTRARRTRSGLLLTREDPADPK